MRNALLATLPLLTIVVIGSSFFLLTKKHQDNERVLGASRIAASTVQISSVTRVTIKKRIVTPSPTISKKQPLIPIKSTATLSPTPTKTILKPPVEPTPTSPKPDPTNTPTPTPAKSELPATPIVTGDVIQSYIIQKINDYRSSQGLGSVSTDSNTCAFARTRANEITQSFNHDGFRSRISAKTLPYGSYHEVTENIAMTADYTQVVTLWINSSGHAENMRKDTPFVCVEKSGNYYAYEGWRP